MIRTGTIIAVVAFAIHTAGAETHRFTPETYYTTYSFAHRPVLRIQPGDRVITKTIDAAGFDSDMKMTAVGGNPQTGPFYIEGAEPGDTIVVTLERIEPNRALGISLDLIAPYALDPGFLRSERAEHERRRVLWEIDKAQGVARLSTEKRDGYRTATKSIEVPLEPMLGCIATAPARKEAIRSGAPGPFGGNMDYRGMVVGSRLMLPVSEPGALLFVGDGHAKQGHGELVGSGIEISMDVEFTVQLLKGQTIAWPRLDNDEFLMVLGSARPLLQALQHATTELQGWLMTDYGFDERTSSLLMGQVVEYEIANVVDPNFTVVAKIKKAHLMQP